MQSLDGEFHEILKSLSLLNFISGYSGGALMHTPETVRGRPGRRRWAMPVGAILQWVVGPLFPMSGQASCRAPHCRLQRVGERLPRTTAGSQGKRASDRAVFDGRAVRRRLGEQDALVPRHGHRPSARPARALSTKLATSGRGASHGMGSRHAAWTVRRRPAV